MKAVLLDVDGVLTDGRIILGPRGFEAKLFDAKDGHRIRLAKRGGLKVYFVTGRRSEAVQRRGDELGIDGVYQGALDKSAVLDEIVRESGLPPEHMAYVGDDLVDLPVMRRVGLGACPEDAVDEVREQADLVLDRPGGRGAVGLFIEKILKAQGTWKSVTARYMADDVAH